MESVAAELEKGGLRVESGRLKLAQTRKDLERGWRAVRELLVRERRTELAALVEQFVNQMSPARTEKGQLAATLLERTREARVKDESLAR